GTFRSFERPSATSFAQSSTFSTNSTRAGLPGKRAPTTSFAANLIGFPKRVKRESAVSNKGIIVTLCKLWLMKTHRPAVILRLGPALSYVTAAGRAIYVERRVSATHTTRNTLGRSS